MHEKMLQWLELLLSIRVAKQVICVRGPREHHDLRDARTHLKNFEIWRLSKSLGVFPEGYRFTSPETFEGLDGTLPDFKEEFSAREIGGVIGEWLKAHKDSRIIILHDEDPYWREACGIANAESTSSMTIQELGVAFNLDTGEKQDQAVEWPRRLGEFLDGLNEVQALKLADYLAEVAHE